MFIYHWFSIFLCLLMCKLGIGSLCFFPCKKIYVNQENQQCNAQINSKDLVNYQSHYLGVTTFKNINFYRLLYV